MTYVNDDQPGLPAFAQISSPDVAAQAAGAFEAGASRTRTHSRASRITPGLAAARPSPILEFIFARPS